MGLMASVAGKVKDIISDHAAINEMSNIYVSHPFHTGALWFGL